MFLTGTDANGYVTFTTNAIERARINATGLGIGATPTAVLTLKAGTATANTAPLKFTSGTNLTNPEAGAMEWDGTNLFVTQTSGPTRKTIAYTSDLSSYVPYTGGTSDVNIGAYNLTVGSNLYLGASSKYFSALSTYGLQTNGWFQATNLIASNTFSEYFSRSDTSTAARIRLVGTDGTGYIAFQINGSEVGRINSSGLLIGSTQLALINTYTPTLSDVANTTTETTALSFVIPANGMNDGDIIEITIPALIKNNSGSFANYTAKVYSGATVIGILASALSFGDGTDTSEYLVIYKVKLYRVGTYLVTIDPAGEGQVKNEMSIWSKDPIATGTNIYYPITATPDFTASQTITVKIQFDVAHATVYFKPQTSRVYKF